MSTTLSPRKSTKKGRARTMGVSRDYTTGNDAYGGRGSYSRDSSGYGGATQTLTRPQRTQRTGRGSSTSREHQASRLAAAPVTKQSFRLKTPKRTEIEIRPQRSTRSNFSRLGSQQVVSNRGRRTVVTREVRLFAKLSTYSIGLLIAGVCLAMWLSGVATTQTFKIGELTVQEATLDNQLETLNRDLENARSAADVSRRAVEQAMGVPVQAGIIEVNGTGEQLTLREAKPELESIIDVNGQVVRPGLASSDPAGAQGVATFQAPQSQSGGSAQPQQGLDSAQAQADSVRLPARAPYSQ